MGAEEGQQEAGHFMSCSEEDNLFLSPQKILNLLDLCLARSFRLVEESSASLDSP